MTDAKILQMPTKASQKNNPFFSAIPPEAQNTDAYPMTNVTYTHRALSTAPDLETGGERNRHWGAVLSIGILPGLSEIKPGPAMLPVMPSILIDSDSLEALRERIIFEIDRSITIAKLQSEDPVEYQRCEQEYLAHLEGNKSKMGV